MYRAPFESSKTVSISFSGVLVYTLLIKMFLAPNVDYSCVCWEHPQIHPWQVLICKNP